MSTSMIENPRAEWPAARTNLLAKEKRLTRERDALAAERRRMPLAGRREFDGPRGKVSLLDLFEGRLHLPRLLRTWRLRLAQPVGAERSAVVPLRLRVDAQRRDGINGSECELAAFEMSITNVRKNPMKFFFAVPPILRRGGAEHRSYSYLLRPRSRYGRFG
jgi:hypothetical protein